MGQIDWTLMQNSLDINTVDRGATHGIERPPGGGSFLFGFNSLSTAQGCVALFANQVDFAPMQKGGSIRGCIQRGPGGGAAGFAPFFFLGAQGNSVNDKAYLLGLSDEDPHKVVLKKGVIATGLPASTDTTLLRKGEQTIAQGTWLHLRLDMIVNPNGDVILQAYRNSLSSNPLGSAPNWHPLSGLSQLVDDALGVNTGSQPFTSGRAGFGFFTKDVTRRGFFDHVEVVRQL